MSLGRATMATLLDDVHATGLQTPQGLLIGCEGAHDIPGTMVLADQADRVTVFMGRDRPQDGLPAGVAPIKPDRRLVATGFG